MRIVIALALAALAGPVMAQSIALLGPDGQTAELNAADLAALPHVSVTADQHGEISTFEGVALGDVVARVGAAQGAGVHGPELATVLRITAADGYQVVLGLAETDPATRSGKVILADRANGAPLAAEDGPFRIVVSDDLRPARSARQVRKIEVIRMATTPPAAAAHH